MYAHSSRVLTAAALMCAPALAGAAPVAGLDAGSGWSPRTVLSASGGWPADVVVAADGTMAAAWARAGHVEFSWHGSGGPWTTPETVAAHGDSPRLGVDRHGTFYLVWSVAGSVWKVQESHSVPGAPWSPPVTVMHRDLRAALADYDVAANGAAVVAVHTRTGVAVKRRAPDGVWSPATHWAKVVDIDLELGGHGLAAAVLTRFVPNPGRPDIGVREVEVTRQRPGSSWTPPRMLQRDRGQRLDPSWPGRAGITVDTAGTTTVAWYGTAPKRPVRGVATSRAVLGGAWSSPRLVISRMGSEHPIVVASAGDRSVLVVAVRNYSRVLAALRPAGASWREPVTVAAQGRFISGWDAARDPDGGAVVAWTRCQGPGYRCDGVWARVMSPRGTWGPQARLGGPQVPDGESTWAAMGHGEALVAWSRYDEKAGHLSLQARTH